MKKNRRILYIGQLGQGTTSLDRMNALKILGHEVTGFNISNYIPENRILRSAISRFQPGFLLDFLNKSVISAAEDGHYDCAWVDKGVWIFPETVEYLKKKCGFVVHFTPDPQLLFLRSKHYSQLLFMRSRHFVKSIPIYDFVITTKIFEMDLYKKEGAKEIILSQQSYCPRRYSKSEPAEKYQSDIGFIGHFEHHYADVLKQFSDDLQVRFWGYAWGKALKQKENSALVERFAGDGIWREDYVNALASFKIGLGLISKVIPEQHTTRTFEIPAAGAFLLAERTPQHAEFFTEGKEAEFFDSPDEMQSKARFYLNNENARKKIADAGRLRCVSSGYDTDSVVRRVLMQMEF